MVDPWEIIGWVVVTVMSALGVFGAIVLLHLLAIRARNQWRHLRTRDIAPDRGQRWTSGDGVIEIIHTFEDGVWVKCGPASWGDSKAEWEQRVRRGRLYLQEGANHG